MNNNAIISSNTQCMLNFLSCSVAFFIFSLWDFNQGSHVAFDYHVFFVFYPKTVLLSFLSFHQFDLFEESKLFVLYKLNVSYCVLIIRSGLHTFDTIVDELCIFY